MTLKIAEFKKNLTVIVLCGGKGQRLRPLTTQVPKPLIRIKKKTILEYILNHLLKFKINNIIIASGYKNRLIKNFVSKKYNDKIEVIDTGINAGILDRIKKIIHKRRGNFLLCYGDTLVDININKLIRLSVANKNKIIVSSYELKSSFGILNINKKNNLVSAFMEKPKLDVWFNVGYIVLSKKFFNNLPFFKKFENLLHFCAKKKLMKSYKHVGKHITINTITELDKAKQLIKKFN